MRPSLSFPWSKSLEPSYLPWLTHDSIAVKNCRHLVLDAGHIAVVSALANKDELREVQSKRGRQYNEDDFKQLEDLMYDRFSLRLEDTQVRERLCSSEAC